MSLAAFQEYLATVVDKQLAKAHLKEIVSNLRGEKHLQFYEGALSQMISANNVNGKVTGSRIVQAKERCSKEFKLAVARESPSHHKQPS